MFGSAPSPFKPTQVHEYLDGQAEYPNLQKSIPVLSRARLLPSLEFMAAGLGYRL